MWSDAFFKTALPRLGLQWQGFRRVHRQVIKRLTRRLQALHLEDLAAYSAYLECHPEEWAMFESFCRITISRFYRDREVFETLCTEVLPRLAHGARARHEQTLRCWSAGCASGEEPYTLAMVWQLCLSPQFPELSLRLLATDVDPHLLARARQGWYTHSSVRELPADWIRRGFEPLDQGYRVRDVFREAVWFVAQDIRHALPPGPWHLILCRNLVFTYFTQGVQRDILARMVTQLAPGGVLVVGKHEALPPSNYGLRPYAAQQGVFQKGAA
jgi:chemotaxis protein methyltransferase CheR